MEQCWLCTEKFTNTTLLHRHLSSKAHTRLRVVCPWCFGREKTFTRIADLKVHSYQCHSQALEAPVPFFSQANGFFMARFPDDYRKIVKIGAWDAPEAFSARDEMMAWCRSQPNPDMVTMHWRAGWAGAMDERSPKRTHRESSCSDIGEDPDVELVEAPPKRKREEEKRREEERQEEEESRKREEKQREEERMKREEKQREEERRKSEEEKRHEERQEQEERREREEKQREEEKKEEKERMKREEKQREEKRRKREEEERQERRKREAKQREEERRKREEKQGEEERNKSEEEKRHEEERKEEEEQQKDGENGRPEEESLKEKQHRLEKEIKDIEKEIEYQQKTKISAPNKNLISRAKEILKVGAMPFCPPGRRVWTKSIEMEIGDRSLEWPPKSHDTMSPDEKLLAWEYMAMSLEEIQQGKFPRVSRQWLLDSYNFLALPGTQDPLPSQDPASQLMRYNTFITIKNIAKGKISHEGIQTLEALERHNAGSKKNIISQILQLINKQGVDLRL